MKAITIAVLSVFMIGCGESLHNKNDRWMTELDCPVILIGKTDKAVNYPSITVRDGSGRVRTFHSLGGGMVRRLTK